jgi:hypothetical protein
MGEEISNHFIGTEIGEVDVTHYHRRSESDIRRDDILAKLWAVAGRKSILCGASGV